jgi:FMN-dependent NADH-azoreductase
LPVFGGDHTAAKMTVIGGASPAGREATAWDSITRLVARFARADAYVFGVPMWNHGVPWVLKHLIDTITQPGLTFGFDLDAGYQGLLQGKRAAAMYSSAIWPSFGDDFHSTYFEGWLRFVGVEEIHSVRLGSNLIDARVDDARVRAHVEATELGRRFALAGSFRAQADARRPPDDAPASVAAALRPTS